MAFTKEQLIELRDIMQEATREVQVLVPSTDYYARTGDFELGYISFIEAWRVEETLNRMIDDRG